MPIYVVVPDKLCGKRHDEEEEDEEEKRLFLALWHCSTMAVTWLFATFDIYVFTLLQQHGDANI